MSTTSWPDWTPTPPNTPRWGRSTAAARSQSTCLEPVTVDPTELRARIEAREWVVDLRDRTAFAPGI